MPLYRQTNSPAQMAQSAMNAATQAAAAQTKQTTTTVRKESSVWDDIYKGAVSLAAVGRGIDSLVGAADSAWQMYDQHKMRKAYEDVSKAFGEGGFEAIQSNPDMLDYWHAQAVGQFVKDRASTEKGRLEMLKSMDAVADKQYQDWRIQAMTVSKAFKAGDMQQFTPLMEQLSASSPLPYRLEGTQDGKFRVMFRSDQHQGWVATGRFITPQEAMNEVNSILQGEQSVFRGLDGKLHPVNPAFNAAAARYYWGTVMGNAENRLDPKKQIPLYDASGNIAGMGVIQNPVDDYSAQPQLLVFDRKGRQIGMYDGMHGVFQAGMSPYKPQKQKGSGGSGGGSTGAYKLTDGDRNALRKAFTTSDTETGEESIDYGMVANLENFMRMSGLSVDAALAALHTNTARAMKAGAKDLPTAQRIAMDTMLRRPLPQRTVTDPTSNQQNTPGTANAESTANRIRNAAGTSGTNSGVMANTDGILTNLGNTEFMSLPVLGASFTPGGSPDARYSLSTADNAMGGNARAGLDRQREADKNRLINAALLYNENYDPAAYGEGAFDEKTGRDDVTSHYAQKRAAKEEADRLRVQEEIKRMRMRAGY